MNTNKWAEDSLSRLLDIKHHHIVMTMPIALRTLAKQNPNVVYSIFFRSTAHVIKEWFLRKHNIKPGIVSVLHTAGSDLKHHPHVHMIVSGGGLEIKSNKCVTLKSDYLARQRFLAKRLGIKMSQELIKEYKKANLIWKATDEYLPIKFTKWMRKIGKGKWIVSIQKPLENLMHIVGYVGRYTKRACISEYKLESINNGIIKFRFTDYKNSIRGEKPKQSIRQMDFVEFFDKLLLHIPNKRFRMVRYYALYNSANRKHLPQYQSKISEVEDEDENVWSEFNQYRKLQIEKGNLDPLICPNCNIKLSLVGVLYEQQIALNDP